MENTKEKKIAIKPLKEVLAYKNDHVVYKFLENFEVTFEEAEDLFMEAKRWLWLCAVSTKKKRMGEEVSMPFVDMPLLILDEMWHTFILFTKDYTKFCEDNFGFYLHHAPTTKEEKDAFRQKFKDHPKEAKAESIDKSEKQFSYIYDVLGEETLVKWYEGFPQLYSIKQIDNLKKSIAKKQLEKAT